MLVHYMLSLTCISLSVFPSTTSQHCLKMAKRVITQTMPHDTVGILKRVFLPCNAMLVQYMLSVCHTHYCIKMAKSRITQTMLQDSLGVLVFWWKSCPWNSNWLSWTWAPNAWGRLKLLTFRQITCHNSKTLQDRHIVSKKVEQEDIYPVLNGYVDDYLGWPLTPQNHPSFYILHCLSNLHSGWTQTSNLVHRLTAAFWNLCISCWKWHGYVIHFYHTKAC